MNSKAENANDKVIRLTNELISQLNAEQIRNFYLMNNDMNWEGYNDNELAVIAELIADMLMSV